jgi:hypothetical protein
MSGWLLCATVHATHLDCSKTAMHVFFLDAQAMCKGVSWYQPFVQLLPVGGASSGGAAAAAAAVVAAAGGRDQAKPQGCFTVVVQPQLPLIKVSVATII